MNSGEPLTASHWLTGPVLGELTNPCHLRSSCNSWEAIEELESRKIDFLPFSDIERAVVNDVEFLKRSRLVPDSIAISGWIYQVENGKTRKVA